jgi:hypothetical protein
MVERQIITAVEGAAVSPEMGAIHLVFLEAVVEVLEMARTIFRIRQAAMEMVVQRVAQHIMTERAARLVAAVVGILAPAAMEVPMVAEEGAGFSERAEAEARTLGAVEVDTAGTEVQEVILAVVVAVESSQAAAMEALLGAEQARALMAHKAQAVLAAEAVALMIMEAMAVMAWGERSSFVKAARSTSSTVRLPTAESPQGQAAVEAAVAMLDRLEEQGFT